MTTDLWQEEIQRAIAESARVTTSLQEIAPQLRQAAAIIAGRLRAGGRLLALGNGGSAAQAQHMVAELVGRLVADRPPIPAVALTTDTSILSAIGNDYGFEELFVRQLRALGRPGDVVLAISTSGNSPNVLRAVETARDMKLKTIGLTGRTGGKMAGRVDLCLCIGSDTTARIQEAHLLISHVLCSLVETSCFSDGPSSQPDSGAEPAP
ncbi:MAG TPA: D-sedoheptulose 7-phosphate isomerase [Candidatus Dormibacteraeota bacterium]|nr:D-sedoheptulose 7-phosphate isomerase [Candidatus Dormibacteraeota bacterium]